MMTNHRDMVTAYGDEIHHALHRKTARFVIDMKDGQSDLKVHIEGNHSVFL